MAPKAIKPSVPVLFAASDTAFGATPSASKSLTAFRTKEESPLVPAIGLKYAAPPDCTCDCTVRVRSSSANAWEGVDVPGSSPRLKRLMVSTRSPSATLHRLTSRRRNWSPCRTVGIKANASAKALASYRVASRSMTWSVLPEPGPPVISVSLGMY